VGLRAMLLEINATADGDTRFAGVAWDCHIPIPAFRGGSVYALLSNGFLLPAHLREEHVPGSWTIFYASGGVGWVVPIEDESGILVAVFGDLWPSGIDLEVQDYREWGSNVYSLRNWLFTDFYMAEGQRIRALMYLYFYSSSDELERAEERVIEMAARLAQGEDVDSIKAEIMKSLMLEEAAAERRRQGPPPALLAFLAFVAATGAVIAYAIFRGRRREQGLHKRER